jgi:phage-related protein (TIGR01555 family)
MSRKRNKRVTHHKVAKVPMALPAQTIRGDGWSNLLTNIGAPNSRVNTTTYAFAPRLDKPTLTNIYTSDSIARQAVNIIVDDAMRGFINAEQQLLEELNRIKVKQKITEAASWARLYGGAAIIAFIDDGQDMDQSLNIENVRKVVSLQTYDRWQLTWSPIDISEDFYSEHYGHPEIFTVNPINGIPFQVHRTRMHLFGGERVPFQQYIANNRWDDSVIQSLYESLRNFGQTMNATAELVQDFIQPVLGVNGLTDMLSQGNEQMIADRLAIIDLSRSVANLVMLDAENETYTKHASSISGLADIIEKQQEHLCSGLKMPITKLFSTATKGLGASGKNDPDNWDHNVEAYRIDTIEPCVNWLIDILELQSTWTDKPESFEWEFPCLQVSNEHEVAKNRLLTAELDRIYIDSGAVSSEFLFKKRYTPSGFQTEIFISEEEMNEIEKENEINEEEANEMELKVNEVKSQMTANSNSQSNSDAIAKVEQIQKDLEQKFLEACIEKLETI